MGSIDSRAARCQGAPCSYRADREGTSRPRSLCRDVPEPNGAVVACACQGCAIGREGDRLHIVGVSVQLPAASRRVLGGASCIEAGPLVSATLPGPDGGPVRRPTPSARSRARPPRAVRTSRHPVERSSHAGAFASCSVHFRKTGATSWIFRVTAGGQHVGSGRIGQAVDARPLDPPDLLAG